MWVIKTVDPFIIFKNYSQQKHVVRLNIHTILKDNKFKIYLFFFISIKFCDPENNDVMEEADFWEKKKKSQEYIQNQKRQY